MARPKTAKTLPTPDLHREKVTGFRIPQDVLDALDAHVEQLNAKAPPGFSTTRNAVVVEILRAATKPEGA